MDDSTHHASHVPNGLRLIVNSCDILRRQTEYFVLYPDTILEINNHLRYKYCVTGKLRILPLIHN